MLDAYFIVIAALLVPAGGIADRVGRKRVFLAGVVIFVAASVACAAAPGWEVLVGARALQGAGAAVVMAVSLALILPEYPLARRAGAVALWGASAALAAASGPPLGGLLVELDWRWVFAVNVPLGALVYALGAHALTESRDPRATGLPDLLGAALTIAGLGALALAILEGGEWGWASARIVGAFVARRARADRRRPPLPHPPAPAARPRAAAGSRASAARTSGSCCSGWRSSRPSSPTSCSSRASGTTACSGPASPSSRARSRRRSPRSRRASSPTATATAR